MHVVFLSDNFPPETNAPAARVFEHAREWVRAGHRVTVVTCAPNFPRGVLYPGYENSWLTREEQDGVEVLRVKTLLAPNRGMVLRTLDYLSFAVMGFLVALFRAPRPDVVVGTSPQFFAAAAAWAVAAVRRRPFVFELRDLWPHSIAAVGVVRRRWLLAWVERFELFLYRRARAVVSVTEAFRRDLVRRGIDGAKIAVVPNGVDATRFRSRGAAPAWARELDLGGRFVVGYVGTFGLAHALENVVRAAERLAARDDILFLLVGDGAGRPRLEAELARAGVANVELAPPRPREDVPALLGLCDVALVHLRDDPVFSTVVPSKIFEAFAAERPVLYAGPPGEASELIGHAGVCVPAEDPSALAEAVRALAGDPGRVAALARQGAARARCYDRAELAAEMLAVLEAVTSGAPPSSVRAGRRAAA